MSAPKRKREVQVNFRVSPEELELIEQKMAQLGNKEPGSLSAEDGSGRLCGTAGLAGAEGTGIPVAPKQQ